VALTTLTTRGVAALPGGVGTGCPGVWAQITDGNTLTASVRHKVRIADPLDELTAVAKSKSTVDRLVMG